MNEYQDVYMKLFLSSWSVNSDHIIHRSTK